MRKLIILIPFLFILQTVKAQDASTIYSYFLEIDCDHDSETNEWTSNKIIISLYKNGSLFRTVPLENGISESQSQAQSIGSAFTKDKAVSILLFTTVNNAVLNSEWDKISISIEGSNAFMIDALAFTWEKKTKSKSKNIGTALLNAVKDPIETRTGTIQTWGVNGGGAWCLSTDPEDGNGDWSDTVNGCFKTVEFNVRTGKAVKIK